MTVLEEPSNNQRPISDTNEVEMLCSETKVESIKQCKEPESIRVPVEMEHGERDRVTKRDLGSERADTLSQT